MRALLEPNPSIRPMAEAQSWGRTRTQKSNAHRRDLGAVRQESAERAYKVGKIASNR